LLLPLHIVYAPLGFEWPAPPRGDWAKAAKGAADSVAVETITSLVSENTVVIFSGSKCAQSKRVKSYFEDAGIPFYALELDQRHDGEALKVALYERAGSSKTPAVYIRGHLVGGSHDVGRAYKSGELKHWTDSADQSLFSIMESTHARAGLKAECKDDDAKKQGPQTGEAG